VVRDWQHRGLRRPPRGHRWIHNDRNDYFLIVIASGLISDVVLYDDRADYWRRSYSRDYSYYDDIYYRECRQRPDPAGIIIGGLIGGLIGHAAGDDRAGPTIAGVIIGSALGAALTRDLDCEDRSYAYRSYYYGLNGGHPGQIYRWHNPRNRHRGEFRVRSYYQDRYGFRCANYRHDVYLVDRHRSAAGRACRQPDGAWAFLN
jgi:surface antigen